MAGSSKKGCLIGCGVVAAIAVLGVVVLVIISVVFKDDIDANTARRRDEAVTGVADISARLQKAHANVQKLVPLTQEKACPLNPAAAFKHSPTSLSQLSEFTPAGYLKAIAPPTEWYRSKAIMELTENLEKGPGPEQWDVFEVADQVEEIHALTHLAVIVPEVQELPTVANENTFDSGFFSGWVVLVNFANQEPECYAHFEAENSATIETTEYTVSGVKVGGGDFARAAREDLEKNFWSAAGAAIDRVRRGQVQAVEPGEVPIPAVSSALPYGWAELGLPTTNGLLQAADQSALAIDYPGGNVDQIQAGYFAALQAHGWTIGASQAPGLRAFEATNGTARMAVVFTPLPDRVAALLNRM